MQNYMKTILSAFKTWVESKIKDNQRQADEKIDKVNKNIDNNIAELSKRIDNSTADWSQNDATSDSYIKNRTHWEEEPKEVEVLPEMTMEFNSENMPYVEAPALTFVANQEYIVNWNDTQYNCKACYTNDGGLAIGNGQLFVFGDIGVNGNDEPFLYVSHPGDFAGIFIPESGTYTMSITIIQSVVHQLDPKYIKDMYHEYMAPNNDIVIEEQTISTDSDYSYVDVGIDSFLVEGASYIVNWNGTEYTCTARYDSWGNLYIGNQEIGIEADDWEFPETIKSNEPFFFYTYEEDNYWGLFAQNAGEHTVSVIGTGEKLTPYKIGMKYMPYRVLENLESTNELWNQISNKMNRDNPRGTGSFGMNRKSGTTTGSYSHAEGYNGTASGSYSHAEGYNTAALGTSSHAEGDNTIALGNYSHAEGTYTQAQSRSQHVQGEYNIIDTKGGSSSRGQYAHIVGNGTSSSDRSNAYTLDWNGNGWFAGNVESSGLVLTDVNNGRKYKIYMQDGNLISAVIGTLEDFYTSGNTITGWKQTLYGEPSTEMILPENVTL